MRVRFTETALAETREIYSYIVSDNPLAARKLQAAIERSLAWIAKWPHTPPIVYDGNVRAKLVTGYQYRIFHTAEDEVVIRNIRSTRRLRPWEDVS